jgi:hypothetical protein
MAKTTKVRLAQGNAERITRVRRAIAKLPELERQLWTRRVQRKLRTGPRVEVGGGATGEWGVTSADAPGGDWDLEIANFLDGVYETVSKRAEEVGEKARKVVTDTTAAVGYSLWPLALAAVAVGWALASARKG